MNIRSLNEPVNRRQALQRIGALTAGAAALTTGCATPQRGTATQVRWSAGTEPPKTLLPENACDCHHHIYDSSQYQWAPEAVLKPGDGTVADYLQFQKRIGTTRNVIVLPSSYGTNNRPLLDSLPKFNGRARGVAVVNTTVTDAQLREMHAAGVRGIRFNLAPPGTTTLEMVKPLAARVAPMGWHVQANAPLDYLLKTKDTWSDLPCPVVFDHMAHVSSVDHPMFAVVRDLMQRKKAYVKLSGFYVETKTGAPGYDDTVIVARAFAAAGLDQCVWGSDWPHPTEQTKGVPDDAALVDALARAVPSAADRQKIFVDTPVRLYDFR